MSFVSEYIRLSDHKKKNHAWHLMTLKKKYKKQNKKRIKGLFVNMITHKSSLNHDPDKHYM